MKRLISRVEKEKPAAVLLLGDILEGHGYDQEKLLPVLRTLTAPLGVWAVPGNRESYGRSDVVRKTLEASGFHLLLNSHVELRPGLVLAGIEYPGRESEGSKG